MNRKTTQRPLSQQAGLTMIELIIAVSILGLVIGVSYRALTNIMATKKILDDERDSRMIANAVLHRMTREIALAVPSKLLPEQESQDQVVFKSEFMVGTPGTVDASRRADSISFMARNAGQYVPDGKSHSGVVQITYRMEEDPEQEDEENRTYYLIRDEIPDIRPLETAYKNRMTFPITNRLLELRFRYYNAREENWTDKWSREQEELPALVQFEVALMSPNGKIHRFSTMVNLGRSLENEEY